MNSLALRRAAATLLVIVPLGCAVCFTLLQQLFEYPDILRQSTGDILAKFAAGGQSYLARGASEAQRTASALLPRWLGVSGAVLAVGIAAGLAEPPGWELGGTINTQSYLIWAVWLIAVGVTLLIRGVTPGVLEHPAPSFAQTATP